MIDNKVTIKPHSGNLLNVTYSGGQTRTRNCAYSALPIDRAPVGNLPKRNVTNTVQAKFETKSISYREYCFRRNVFLGLLVLLYIIANLYFVIISAA